MVMGMEFVFAMIETGTVDQIHLHRQRRAGARARDACRADERLRKARGMAGHAHIQQSQAAAVLSSTVANDPSTPSRLLHVLVFAHCHRPRCRLVSDQGQRGWSARVASARKHACVLQSAARHQVSAWQKAWESLSVTVCEQTAALALCPSQVLMLVSHGLSNKAARSRETPDQVQDHNAWHGRVAGHAVEGLDRGR
jgi:hypothetical protein